MAVRAKFVCTEIKRIMGSVQTLDGKSWEQAEMRSIVMMPVYGNGHPDHENTKFWRASPSGRLELNVVNLAAAEQFELNKEYYLDFTPAG